MDIYESIKQDKENDRVFEELQNQDMFGTNVIICPPNIPQVAPMNMIIAVGYTMYAIIYWKDGKPIGFRQCYCYQR
jgi:hypothetical protein